MIRALPLLAVACLPDISQSLDPGPADDDPTVVVTEPTDTTVPVAEITMDATDTVVWVGLDVDTFDPTADPDGTTWDLRFRRFEVALNGGASGDGGVEVAWTDTPFDDLTTAPDDAEWVTDAPDADGDGAPELALVDWYLYDEATHQLSPAPGTWLVRSTDGTLHRLVFDAYYDSNGTPARILLRTGPLTPMED